MIVAVLAGGSSSERDVSLVSGAAMARAARNLGHRVDLIDPADGSLLDFDSAAPVGPRPPQTAVVRPSSGRVILETVLRCARSGAELVINGLHGGAGENGAVQAACELAGLPYTGSGVMASALAMNKVVSKRLFAHDGVPTPSHLFFERSASFGQMHGEVQRRFHYPVVVKPNGEGSTVGLTIVREERELQSAWNLAAGYGDVLVEEYIAGREITVSVLGDRALPVIEIKPEGGFYDYEHKYTKGKTTYVCPAEIAAAVAAEVQRHALTAFRVLGCRGYARVDFRLSTDNRPFCLEVNTLPGMTETSLVPKAALAAGIGFDELVDRIIRLAGI